MRRFSLVPGLCVAMLSVNVITLPGSPFPGLIAAYSLNEGSGTTATDFSGHNITGTLKHGPLWTEGKYGGALSFDGADDSLNLGSPEVLDNVNTFTYCAWVYPRSMGGQRDGRIVHKGNNNQRKQFQTDVAVANSLALLVDRGTTAASAVSLADTLTLNEWQYVCATYSETDGPRLYVNGVEIPYSARIVGSGPMADESSQEFQIGNRPNGDKGWDGLIDEVRVYDRIISRNEMIADMYTPIGGELAPARLVITSPLPEETISGKEINVAYLIVGNVPEVNHVHLKLDDEVEVIDTDQNGLGQFTNMDIGQHTLHGWCSGADGSVISGSDFFVNFTTVPLRHLVNELAVVGVTVPTSIEFLPDERMLIGTFDERIQVVQPGAAQPDSQPVLQIDASGLTGEQGLFDIAVDNNFSENGYIYAYYTKGSANRDRLSRFTMSGNSIDPSTESVIWQNSTSSQSQHHGGAIAFGNDGKIYLSTGERDIPSDAQLLTNPNGKILRLNFDGTVPTDNPFYDGDGPNDDAIWAYGLRNPFRMTIDPVTGNMYISDVGGDQGTSHEELNLGIAGANYGWPDCDGPCNMPGVVNPIYSYAHGSSLRDACIAGGFIYRGSEFPPEYQGNYFFVDYAQNWIRRLTFTDSSLTEVNRMLFVDPPDGALDDASVGDPVDIKQGPDGWIYYIDFDYSHRPDHGKDPSPAAIRRIRFASNQPPVVVISANPTIGAAPLAVHFSSDGTSDPEADPLTYAWDFGDAQSSTSACPIHTYQTPGPYTARLMVSDGANATLSHDINIVAGVPPEVSIVTPADLSTFRGGDVISFVGDGSDAEGGPLSDSAFEWTVEFLHDSHVHPGGRINGTRSFDLPIPVASGHDFTGDTSYRVSLTVRDSDGLQNSSSVTIYPEKVNLSFDSVPTGRTIKIDALSYTTPFIKDSLVNYQHTVEAVETSDHTFFSWSDGGAQTHTLVVPAAAASYTAMLRPADLPHITGIGITDGALSLSFPSAVGWTYVIEYQDNLGAASWETLLSVPGNGAVQTISDPQPAAASRFYRLQLE